MLDHVLLDVISAIRHSFERALLERQSLEERFLFDVFLGDVSWETSYSLPGEGNPPRVRADLSLDWPTWSQSAYRSWSIGEPAGDLPEIAVELALRVQRLMTGPNPKVVLAALPNDGPMVGSGILERSGPTVEQSFDNEESSEWAVEISYQGSWLLEERLLEHPEQLEEMVQALGRWVASTLVRLGDLDLGFYPREDGDESNDRQ
jgi:hypothetical protein